VQKNSNNKSISGNLKLKLADLSAPTESESNISLMLNNYKTDNARYTKVNLEQDINYDGSNKAFTLNIAIPKNDIGLIMFYYIDEKYKYTQISVAEANFDNLKSKLYIKTDEGYEKVGDSAEFSSEVAYYTYNAPAHLEALGDGAQIKRYNYSDNARTEYPLVPGIQVIRLNHQVTSLEVYADDNKKGTIIFGELSLINTADGKSGINENLKYQAITESTALAEMLKDIRTNVQITKDGIVDDQFYYNMPIDNNRAINLNPLLEENLLSAEAWYDSNNENNKFVVTEIDADYLDKGITLTKASRII
jgi:hypothetical protein